MSKTTYNQVARTISCRSKALANHSINDSLHHLRQQVIRRCVLCRALATRHAWVYAVATDVFGDVHGVIFSGVIVCGGSGGVCGEGPVPAATEYIFYAESAAAGAE